MCPKGLSARTSSTAEVVTAKTAEAQVVTASGSATAKTASTSASASVSVDRSGRAPCLGSVAKTTANGRCTCSLDVEKIY